MLDLERNGQGAMMTCSGAYKDGSLRVVRNGIGVREEADIELPGIQGVWSLKDSADSEFHKMLVQTFATETRILALEKSEEEEDEGAMQLAECTIAGFDAAQRTLYCANVGEMLLQVTQSSCRLVDAKTKELVDEWRVPAEVASGVGSGASANITVASANSSQVLLAAGRVLMLLSLAGRKLRLDCHTTMDQEISCLDVTPLNGAATASFVAVCMWHDYTVRVLRASTLEEVSRERLGETVARSVLFAQFEGAAEGGDVAAPSAIGAPPPATYLMCGLGDGNLISFELQPSNAALSGRKKLAIGTSGLELRSFSSRSSLHVFASCDRPTVISCAHGRLLYSNVNSKSVSHMAPFNAETVFQDCLALVSSSRLLIAHMDEIQRLHISKVKTGGQPRRLAHHAPSKTVAVVVVEQALGDAKDNLTGETHKIKLYEEDSFRLAHTFTLGVNETGLSIASLRINTQANVAPPVGAAAAAASAASSSSSAAAAASPASSASALASSFPEYLVVGTAFLNPEEAEPSLGRLLVLEVVSASASATGRPQLRLVSEQTIMGGAWTIDAIQGRIIAAINARVVVYRCVTSAAGAAAGASSSSPAPFKLEKECDFSGGVMVLQLVVSRSQEYVFVGDMMKSVSILRFNTTSNANGIQAAKSASSLEEVVRDYDSAWLTALASFSPNDDVCIFADHHFNLVTLRRPIEAATEEDRARMECVGKWHAGEMINKIGPGSLIMQLPNEPSDAAVVAATTSASSSSSSAPAASSLEPFDRVVPTHLYGTLSGSIGVLAPLTTNSYKFFARLEEKIEVIIKGVGNLSHKEWRAFHNDRRTDDSTGFIGQPSSQQPSLPPTRQTCRSRFLLLCVCVFVRQMAM